MVVHLNIVVFCLFTVNLSLDLVPVIVEDEEVWLDPSSEHRSDLLQSKLERAVPDEQDGSAFLAGLLRGKGCAETCSNRPTDSAPQDLGHISRVGWEWNVCEAERGCTGLGQDDVCL